MFEYERESGFRDSLHLYLPQRETMRSEKRNRALRGKNNTQQDHDAQECPSEA